MNSQETQDNPAFAKTAKTIEGKPVRLKISRTHEPVDLELEEWHCQLKQRG